MTEIKHYLDIMFLLMAYENLSFKVYHNIPTSLSFTRGIVITIVGTDVFWRLRHHSNRGYTLSLGTHKTYVTSTKRNTWIPSDQVAADRIYLFIEEWRRKQI